MCCMQLGRMQDTCEHAMRHNSRLAAIGVHRYLGVVDGYEAQLCESLRASPEHQETDPPQGEAHGGQLGYTC
jgi:hypothetical protein